MVLLFWRTVKYMLDWRVDMQYYFDMANERTIEEKRAFLERLLAMQVRLRLQSGEVILDMKPCLHCGNTCNHTDGLTPYCDTYCEEAFLEGRPA